jgi:hypothetical protein
MPQGDAGQPRLALFGGGGGAAGEEGGEGAGAGPSLEALAAKVAEVYVR